jgi:hypothetical protein
VVQKILFEPLSLVIIFECFIITFILFFSFGKIYEIELLVCRTTKVRKSYDAFLRFIDEVRAFRRGMSNLYVNNLTQAYKTL